MKKISFLFLMTLLSTLTANAYDAEVDGIFYNLNSDTKEATVTSDYNDYKGSITIPEAITYDGVTYSVTFIGNGAFGYCSKLTSVTIGNSVESIAEWGSDGFLHLLNASKLAKKVILDSRPINKYMATQRLQQGIWVIRSTL